jgi:hypothetical protein
VALGIQLVFYGKHYVPEVKDLLIAIFRDVHDPSPFPALLLP